MRQDYYPGNDNPGCSEENCQEDACYQEDGGQPLCWNHSPQAARDAVEADLIAGPYGGDDEEVAF